MLDYQPTRRIVLFLYEKENKRTAYLYDAEAQVLKKLNGPLWSAGTTIGRSLWAESERTYCLLLNTDRNREETLLLVNLLTGEMRSVAPWAHKSAEDGYFSPTGKYVIFTKGDSNVESVKRQTVVYTIATASIKEIQGQVRHILPDDSGMVVDTLDGLMLFCGDTGKVTPFDKAELPLRYRYHVQRGEQYANDCYPLLIVDLLTGETVTTLPQEVHAWQTDSQGRYLYYYVRERDGVTCRDIATGQEFSVPVSKEFVDMQRRYGDKEMQFYLLLDEQHKTLQLSYIRYDRPREDSQAIREQLAGDVSYQYTNRVQKGVSSLADFGTLIRQFPEGLILHRAEGYVYLDCTAWLGHAAYWVEDYRKGLFYYVHYNGRMGGIPLGIDGVTPLADGAKAHTEDLCRQYALPVASVAFDYGHLLTDNGVDWGALAAYNYAADRLLAEVDSYTVYSKEGLESGQATTVYSRESAEDMRQLREFLDFVNSLTYRHTDAYGKYQDSYQAIIHMPYDVYEATVWLGRYDGKPVVVLGTTYAHCTEEDYACWKNWALKKAEECYMPPAEEETEEEYTSTTTDTHKTVASRKSGVNGR